MEESQQDAELAALTRRPRHWLWIGLAVLTLGGAGLAALLLRQPLSPTKVLIAAELDGYWWEGSEASATITDVFGTRLSALGFEPVKAGDPKVMQVLEQARSPSEAAKALGAAFVVSAQPA